MELPAFLPMTELLGKVDETIRIMNPELLVGTYIDSFMFNGKPINQDSSLASTGVWDGCTLDCQMRKEVSV